MKSATQIKPDPSGKENLTLDPSDWESFRALGHRMLDDMVDALSALDKKPTWQQMPDHVKAVFTEKVPMQPQGEEQVYEEFLANILPYPNGNWHPRHWGWVHGNGIPFAMLADMLASGLNPHLSGFNHAPRLVEQQVIDWLAELMGMPKTASGLLTSGGSMANILSLAVARHAKAGFDVREEGVQGEHPKLVMYCSPETHSWAQKAVELMGLGNKALRRIKADASFRMDLADLKTAIAQDKKQGLRPICVIATAGTVNTGATDDLMAIADLCQQENLWFHIDGAFGALARLSPKYASLVNGMEKADSIAFDLHKWMYFPFEAACMLVRDGQVHHDTFTLTPSYLHKAERGVIAGGLCFAERGVELTRSFKALKIWMCLKAYGVEAFGRIIEQNIEQAKYLALLVEQHPDLELMAEAEMNVVCYRYAPKHIAPSKLNALNQELLIRIQESGIAVPSGTLLNGIYVLRVAITNHRTKFSDLDLLIECSAKIGGKVAKEIIG